MTIISNKTLDYFLKVYGNPHISIFVPGRANIIGEHLDYNGGKVIPFAIDLGIHFYARPNEECGIFNFYSFDLMQYYTFNTNDQTQNVNYEWAKFIYQVAQTFSINADLNGWDVVFGGDLPIGAGISSSSALTVGCVALLDQILHTQLTQEHIISRAVIAERGYGVQGGIMDQYTIVKGKENNAIVIDCSNNTSKYLPLNLESTSFYLVNTNVKHALISSDYNQRRNECQEALSFIQKKYENIQYLSHISQAHLEHILHHKPESYQRVKHVFSENIRVHQAEEAIIFRKWSLLGDLLYQSHESLKRDFSVSCPELDFLVEWSKGASHIFGARMMGGGFGGSVILLATKNSADRWFKSMSQAYTAHFGLEPTLIPINPSQGLQIR